VTKTEPCAACGKVHPEIERYAACGPMLREEADMMAEAADPAAPLEIDFCRPGECCYPACEQVPVVQTTSTFLDESGYVQPEPLRIITRSQWCAEHA
jgi:hypothetical protein